MNRRDMDRISSVAQRAYEIERQVISMAVIQYDMSRKLDDINSDEFLDKRLGSIRDIICNMRGQNKDVSITSVYNEIMDDSLKKFYAVEIACDHPLGSSETIFMQFKQTHRMVAMQPYIEELFHMSLDGDPNFEDKFEELSLLYSSSKVSQEAIVMRDLFKDNPEKARERYTRFKTTIPSLDAKIKWLYSGQYITIAAAPGEGKSTLAMLIAERTPDSLIMSYEMSAEEIHDIMISRKTSIDSEKIEDGLLDFHERQLIEAARRELADTCSLMVCDKPLNMNDMFAFIKYHVQKYRIKLVVIDYAQIVPNIPGKGNQTEKFELLSRRLKLIAREENIVVIALSQLSKDSIREGRAPNLSDLRGSLSFGADADKVIFLYTVPDEENVGTGITQCAIGKNRKGKIGKVEGFYYNKPIHFMR